MTRRKLSNASAVDILRYHRSLLADEVRTRSYADAIGATVRAGDVVVDIGCGTGILSFFACRAGAKRVYAIDELPVIELARALARDNGFEDRIVFLNTLSFDAAIDEPVDAIVTETMGNNGFDEHIAGAVAHAKRAWLREGGAIVPGAVAMHGAPAEFPPIHEAHALWYSQPYGFDFARAGKYALNGFYPADVAPERLLATPVALARVELGELVPIRGAGDFVIARDATLHGIAVWFRAELTAEIAITNEPPNRCPSWKQSFFPLAVPLAVQRGEAVRIEVQTFDGIEWGWRVEHGGVTHAQQSTFFGFPFTPAR